MDTQFKLSVDIYELGYDLAKGLLPALEAYRDHGGTAAVSFMGKPVMASKHRDEAVEKMVNAFKLLSSGEDPAELSATDKAVVADGLLEFSDAIANGGLWL
jgi:hypothetical protein